MKSSISWSAAYYAYYGDTFLNPRDLRPCVDEGGRIEDSRIV